MPSVKMVMEWKDSGEQGAEVGDYSNWTAMDHAWVDRNPDADGFDDKSVT